MTRTTVTPSEPTPNTLIGEWNNEPDYRDAYLVGDAPIDDIATFATQFFMNQPSWLAKVSMNTRTRHQRLEAIGAAGYEVGSAVGTWKVHGRSADEIVFGEHMGFMEYRFSFLRRADGRIEASTSVEYVRRFGHAYFTVVKPFHVRFVKIALRNAIDPQRRRELASVA